MPAGLFGQLGLTWATQPNDLLGHGAQAEGKAKVLRLAGQNESYVLSELEKFKVDDRQHAPEMTMVTKHVESEQFRAIAEYLQSR